VFREHSLWRQWLLEHELADLLNRYHKIEKFLYRHHRVIGTAVIAGALTLLTLIVKLHDAFASSTWSHILGIQLAILFSWALAILALIIGIFLLIRPSALKGIEVQANRWIGPSPATSLIEKPAVKGINALILRFPKHTGILLLLAGIGCLRTAASLLTA